MLTKTTAVQIVCIIKLNWAKLIPMESKGKKSIVPISNKIMPMIEAIAIFAWATELKLFSGVFFLRAITIAAKETKAVTTRTSAKDP